MTVRGHIDIPAALLDAVRAALPAHVRLSRAEPGCLRFDLHEDPDTPGRLLVDEAFVDKAAFEAHQARAGDSAWGRLTRGIPRHFTVEDTPA